MKADTHYIGNELELFSHATHWKKYWGSFVQPYLGKKVLEVGSGLGGTTRYLIHTPGIEKWVCLEPDHELSKQSEQFSLPEGTGKVELITSYLADFHTSEKFDSLLYADVIEHIENDASELKLAASFLKEGGHLLIIVPAHPFLFSEFDREIGHYRRYSRTMLEKALPADIRIVKSRYLDAVGLLASLSNKVLLKQRYPTVKQIQFWDNVIVPVSAVVDRLFGYNLGKSIVFIGRKGELSSR